MSYTLGLGVGMGTALARQYGPAPLRWFTRGYIGVFRGPPLLVQILFVYYALPALLPALRFSEFWAAALALASNVGAYNGEALRGGLGAVGRDQLEAARDLGASSSGAFWHIELPQAFRVALPALTNNLAALLKDSALASSIGLLELTLVGNRISSETFDPVPVLTTVAVFYLLMTSLLTLAARGLEARAHGP